MNFDKGQGKHKPVKSGDFAGKKVLIMGLGLHGGGIESARYLAACGAEITVTDLRDEKILAKSIETLKTIPIRYVMGRHEIEDFKKADIVIKNPGVRPDSPFLKAAKRVETDLSIFLSVNPARILGVTGSKGKSTTSSALFWVLNESVQKKTGFLSGKAYLGGNITISPLSFLDELEEKDTVVLELSSFQLGDLRGQNLLRPRTALITPIMRDHLDRYGTMEAYVADKHVICENQEKEDATIVKDDDWGKGFLNKSRGRPLIYSEKPLGDGISGAWISDPGGSGFARLWEISDKITEIVPAHPLVPGFHQKQNLLAAGLALLELGMDADFIRESLGRFPGIEHRLEFFHESEGIRFYNDSAATIPEAAAAAIAAFDTYSRTDSGSGAGSGREAGQISAGSLVLVTGGTDKGLDFTPLAAAAVKAREIILLAGSGTEKLKNLFERDGIKYRGPFDSVDGAVKAVLEAAVKGDSVVLSPGCTSFEMFKNEFDRGTKWKEGVKQITNNK